MKRTLLTLICSLFALAASADEGMWLPSLISQRIDDMRAKGFRLTAEDIYSINKASMKDAVVLFDGGCTGDEDFHTLLDEEWTEIACHRPIQWWGIHDDITVFERKPKLYADPRELDIE